MMSHEEHHQPEEEDGDDEEGDMEARTAVEALLALTSPTDYTHHTDSEEKWQRLVHEFGRIYGDKKRETSLGANGNICSKIIATENRNKPEAHKELVTGEIFHGFINRHEKEIKPSQTFEQMKGAIKIGKEKSQNVEGVEINRKQMEECESRLKKELQSTGDVIKPKEGNSIDSKTVRVGINSDGSDTDSDSDSESTSDTSSSSSSGSDSSSSDSSSDGSDSDSDSDTDSKSTEKSEKRLENTEKQLENIKNNEKTEKLENKVNEKLVIVDSFQNQNAVSFNKVKDSKFNPCKTEEKFNSKEMDNKPIEVNCKDVKLISDIKKETSNTNDNSDKCLSVKKEINIDPKGSEIVNGGGEGEVVEYPSSNNILPSDGSDLTQWQLDGVHLPPFTPNVAPPSWLRLTIPAEGYRCQSCGDTFFIESSLVQHRERRSVWISLECGPCDAKLTFYNRCALKDHLRNHLMQGEEVDEETVEVRSLPLQLTRLLQPILVPVPKSLRVANKKVRRGLKGRGSVNKLPVLKLIGRSTTKLTDEYLNGSLEDHFGEDESEGFADFGDEDIRSHLKLQDKIPSGMKRLSTRKRTVRCYLCERMFHSVRELMAHMRTDQPYSDQRVECKKCQLVLPSVCAAKAHILTHPPANTSNMSVCPECGSRCDGPREFVHHLNTCGHQFRRSGIVCTECQVCFFKSQDDFLTHWIAEHCAKSYECVVCRNTFESLVFHKCTSPGQQVLATFRCLLTCPLCSLAVQLHAQEERDTNAKIRAHLADAHPTIITRVHYVYKSKFCTNAFRSKDELRAHHDREHRRDNHYRTKTCTLHHEVLGYQHQYFNGQEPRNAFVTLPVALSAEELHEARIRDVPTVSSVIDKTLFPDLTLQDSVKTGKIEKQIKNKVLNKSSPKEVDPKDTSGKESPAKKDMDQLDKLRPKVCYRCGYKYADNKDFRRHKRTCEGESAERHCQVCGMAAVGEDFARHCLGHIQDGAVLCIYCNGTQFNNSSDLEQHFELHVHEQFFYPAICAFCCTSLPDVATALAHLNEEHDPLHVPFDTSEFECDRCGRRFHGERGLSVHLGRCTLGTATPTPSAGCRQCQVCTKALTPEMFGRHLVCHLEEGLLVCSLCDGRTLPSSMALLHHLEEHAAALAYPNSCPMCSFVMQDADSALSHLKEEHGFGNLHCAECDMHFNFTYQLQRHTDIVHKICQYAKRRYICWICRAYDHVKKETLMNHFRTVHGLDREQVDEKVMIRTRGQGTMPTSQFIPTKPLGSKENPGISSASKSDSENMLFKAQKEKTKGSPGKSSSTNESLNKQSNNVSSQESPVKSSPNKPVSSLVLKKVSAKRSDVRLKDKTKVLIKRFPDSILDEQSRSKRRKILSDDLQIDPESDVKKEVKKRKKKKAHRCNICNFGTNSKEKFDNHILKHKELGEDGESDGFVCHECGASFVVEPSLTRHMFFAHKVKLHVSSADENEDNDNIVSDLQRTKTLVKEPKNIKEKENEITTNEMKEEKVIQIEKEPPTIKYVNDINTKRKTVRITTKKKIEKEAVKKQLEVRTKIKVEGIIRKKEAKAITKKKVEKVIKKKLVKVTPRQRRAKEVSKRKIERALLGKSLEEDDDIFDNQCVVCKEEFVNPVELYSHLRTHGMAFLKLGRKARPLGLGKPDQ
nr:zinc finger protein Xfin-like [Cherax quadricarinatus]